MKSRYKVIFGLIFLIFLLSLLFVRPAHRYPAKATKLVLHVTRSAIEEFDKICGKLPNSLSALVEGSSDCKEFSPSLKKYPTDGWSRRVEYKISGSFVILRSLGEDGVEGGDGKSADIVEQWNFPVNTSIDQ